MPETDPAYTGTVLTASVKFAFVRCVDESGAFDVYVAGNEAQLYPGQRVRLDVIADARGRFYARNVEVIASDEP